jgi:cellulose synthase (UDP-forming)
MSRTDTDDLLGRLIASAPRPGRHRADGQPPTATRSRTVDVPRPGKTDGRPSGRHAVRRQRPDERSTVADPVFTPAQRRQYVLLAAAWVAVSLYFWTWWLRSSHIGNPALFALVSVATFYIITVLPSFYLFFLGWMRRPRKALVTDLPPGAVGRVAVITLTVPGSESLDIVRRQLVAIRDLTFRHDSWILVDGRHSPEIAAMAAELGVNYFCRHDADTWGADQVARWNAPAAPFQAKTKAGNVNAWIDAQGEAYSHFTQLDIDHHPLPGYLEAVLGYFRNPRVAWVQAPSVVGNYEYWTARGTSEQEFVLQGPLQMGFFGFSRTPFIIGSHCTYDMRAIRAIGGFQPTRAEDHLDTVCLAAIGREGVYLPEIIAVGDGPESFETYLAQQFAWAYSMIQVLFFHTPRLLRNYTRRQAVQFLFVQTWYTFWSVATAALFAAPALSLVFDQPVSTVSILDYVAHSWPVGIVATGLWYWSRCWHQPRRVSLTWRGIALHLARWVVVLSALVQVAFRIRKPYMITSKGISDGPVTTRLSAFLPFLLLTGLALTSCWLYLVLVGHSSVQGMLFFALVEAVLFVVLLGVVLTQDVRSLRSGGTSVSQLARVQAVPLGLIGAVVVLTVLTALWSAQPIWTAWANGLHLH